MSSPDTAVRFRGCSPYPPEELEQFKLLLIERRGELASETYEQELSIEMMSRVQDELNAMQDAIDRIHALRREKDQTS